MCNQVITVTDIKHKHQLHFVNLPFLLQHVYYEPIYPASFDQIPHHASKMSGGMQQLVFSMLIQVFISGSVYLHMTGHKNYFNFSGCCRCSRYIFVTHKLSLSLFCVQITQQLVTRLKYKEKCHHTRMYSAESGSNWTRHRFRTCSWWS